MFEIIIVALIILFVALAVARHFYRTFVFKDRQINCPACCSGCSEQNQSQQCQGGDLEDQRRSKEIVRSCD